MGAFSSAFSSAFNVGGAVGVPIIWRLKHNANTSGSIWELAQA